MVPCASVKLGETASMMSISPQVGQPTEPMFEPSIQKATASSVMKPAKLETGLVINVPPFVGTGDKVKVDTSEARYIQRVQ